MALTFYRLYQGQWIGLPTPPIPPPVTPPPVVVVPPVTPPGSPPVTPPAAPPPPPVSPTGVTKRDASNTGYLGASLKNYAGDFTNLKAGEKVTNLAITGGCKVTVTNVWFDQCLITPTYTVGGAGAASPTLNRGIIDATAAGCTGLKVTNSELYVKTSGISVGWTGILGHDYTAQYCNVHDTVDAFGVYNAHSPNAAANVSIEYCFGHDLTYIAPDPNHPPPGSNATHNDGCQIQGNGTVRIYGSTLWCNASANSPSKSPYGKNAVGQCVSITPNVSSVPNVDIEECWMDYGSYCLHYINNGSKIAGPSLTLKNIRFGRNAHFGPVDIAAGISYTASGLVYDDNGAAVPIVRS